jgi:hypothetical protein
LCAICVKVPRLCPSRTLTNSLIFRFLELPKAVSATLVPFEPCQMLPWAATERRRCRLPGQCWTKWPGRLAGIRWGHENPSHSFQNRRRGVSP